MNRQEQIQETKSRNHKQPSTFAKAQLIAASCRIHKSSVSDIWLVESETRKNKFYAVQYVDVEGEGELICDCPAYIYSMTVPCKHILACCCLQTLAEIKKEVLE